MSRLRASFLEGLKEGLERAPTFLVMIAALTIVRHYAGFEAAVFMGLAGIGADIAALAKKK